MATVESLARDFASLKQQVAQALTGRPRRGRPGARGAKGEAGATGSPADTTFLQDGTGATTRKLEDRAKGIIDVGDFYPLVGGTWRTALVNALSHLQGQGGGRIKLYKSATKYSVNNTGLGPIDLSYDGIEIEGDSGYGSVIENASTDGTALFRFTGVGGRDFVCFRNLKIESGTQAGEVWTFANDTGLGKCSLFQNVYVWQRNPAKAGMLRYDDVVGAYEATFDNCYFDHGTNAGPPTVAFFDLGGTIQSVQNIEWRNCRVNCHFSQVPFWDIKGDAASVYQTGLRWTCINVEQARRNVIRLAGVMGAALDTIVFYDSTTGESTDPDGHFIETVAGAGGRECTACLFRNITIKSGAPKGVNGTLRAATPFTGAGSTVTFTFNSHGYVVGQRLYVTGGGLTAGRYTVVAKTTNTFDITHSSPPASGNADVSEAACAIKLGSTATRMVFDNINGPSGAFPEVDLNQRSADVRGGNTDVLYSRVLETSTTLTYSGSGGVARVETPLVKADTVQERTSGNGIVHSHLAKLDAGASVGSGGATLTKVLITSAALDFPDLAPGAEAELTVTLSGIITQDRVVAAPLGGGPEAGLSWNVWVSATDTIKVRMHNHQAAGNVNPASRTWHFTVFKHT